MLTQNEQIEHIVLLFFGTVNFYPRRNKGRKVKHTGNKRKERNI